MRVPVKVTASASLRGQRARLSGASDLMRPLPAHPGQKDLWIELEDPKRPPVWFNSKSAERHPKTTFSLYWCNPGGWNPATIEVPALGQVGASS